jgi:hyaluronan synthase
LKPAGRRYALATGIALATGDLIAFCDADGFVLPDSLRNLVSRFSAPDTAAVTGQDEAENEASGFTARMQGAGRFLACRVLQAAESVTGSVSCLTSPLMAFRRDRINEALDEWLAQQISEDPDEFGTTDGLIGCILRRGGRVVYESGARIVLPVPDRFPEARTRLFRTQVARLEESLRTPGWPRSARPLALLPIHGGILLTLVSPFLVLRALVWLARMRRPEPLLCLVCVFIVYALACSLYLLFKRPRSCVPGFFFWGLFSLWTVVQSIGVLFAAGRPRVAADRAVS